MKPVSLVGPLSDACTDGVSRLVLEHCDMYAKLPLEGEVASLNVAQAATAVMYEWLRQNR